MNYLKANLDNSLILPYDVMLLIYEYADPFTAIRPLIERDNNDMLEDIMYKRMINYIKKGYLNTPFGEYDLYDKTYGYIVINMLNIDDKYYKDKILNCIHGYREYFLWKSKVNKICGKTINELNLGWISKDLEIKYKMDIALGKQIDKLYIDDFRREFKVWLKL
jgi:hypothetical protein